MLGRAIADGRVELACLTDEEMASINADEDTPSARPNLPSGCVPCPRMPAPPC